MGGYPTEHVSRNWTETLLGRDLKSFKTWSVFVGRIVLAWTFLWAGYEKIEVELAGRMATKGFLAHAGGPFASFFQSLAGNWGVEYLLVYGELAIGISLMIGLFTRVGSISGVLMVGLMYVAQYPPANNPFMDEYWVYAALFLVLAAFACGRFLGIDGILVNFTRQGSKLNKIFRMLG